MMNIRPLSLSLHPHIKNICKQLKETPGVVTPFSLHFGLPPVKEIIIPFQELREPVSRDKFIKKWKHIISEYNKLLQLDLEKRREILPKTRQINIGDLVVLKNNIAHKESLRFYKNIYEVVAINQARYTLAPLFFKGKLVNTNGNNLKPYESSELLQQLPQGLRNLLGENLSAEELKKHAQENPDFLPDELHSWNRPTTMSLRNRLAPKDKLSEPALSVFNTDILTSSSDSSTIFSIPSRIPDFTSEVSSLVKRQGASQLKTTQTGLAEKTFITPPPVLKTPTLPLQTPPYRIEHFPIPFSKTTSLTLEDIDKSWETRLVKQNTNDIKPLAKTATFEPVTIKADFSHIPSENITVRKKPPKLDSKLTPEPVITTPNYFNQTIKNPLNISKNTTHSTIDLTRIETPPAKINDTLPSPIHKTVEQTDQVAQNPLAKTPPVPASVVEPEISTSKTNITPEIHPTKEPKISKKHSRTIPEDSIKYRLRNATLKPFKFLKK